MHDQPRKGRGRPIDPRVIQREEDIYAALDRPCTSRAVSQALSISTTAVRLSLKQLRKRGVVDLHKVDGTFLWSRHASEQ